MKASVRWNAKYCSNMPLSMPFHVGRFSSCFAGIDARGALAGLNCRQVSIGMVFVLWAGKMGWRKGGATA